MRLLILLGLLACDAGLPPPAPTTPPPAVSAPIVRAGGRSFAIVRVTEGRPEPCMDGAPASNWTFSVEGAALKLYGGGHGISVDDTTLPGRLAPTPNDPSWSDRYYVAEIALASHGQIEEPVTCNGIEGFDGTVLAVAPARDLEDARAQLAAAPVLGLQSRVRLGVAPWPSAPSTIEVAGHTYAVVRLQRDCGEATNLGGEHWAFDIDGMPGFQLHGGGHGIFGDGKIMPGGFTSNEVWVGRYYVAEVTLFAKPSEVPGLSCTSHETYDGAVAAVSPAKDRDDAWRQLAAIPTTGLQPMLRIDRENSDERMKGRAAKSVLHWR